MTKSPIKNIVKISLVLTGVALAGISLGSCAQGEGGNPPSTVFDSPPPSSAPRGSH